MGLSYADEPALAILEVQNEDCVFFHAPLTALNNPDDVPLHSALFRQQWAQWVKERYDTDEALRAAWGEDGLRAGDSVNADEMALFGAWEMTANGPPNLAQTARLGDFNRSVDRRPPIGNAGERSADRPKPYSDRSRLRPGYASNVSIRR